MKTDSFKKSVDFLVDTLLPLYGYEYDHSSRITLQYVGGEIATVLRKSYMIVYFMLEIGFLKFLVKCRILFNQI